MQRSLSGSVTTVQIEPLLQKELHDFRSPVSARQTEGLLEIFLADVSFWFAAPAEILLEDIELTHASRGRERQLCAAIGKISCGFATTICEAAPDRTLLIAAAGPVIDFRAMVQQDLYELVLHTGVVRMHAGRSETERRGAASVNICFRIHLGARVYKQFRDLNDVSRRPLPVSLDAIGRNVMQQRCTMFMLRSDSHQSRIRFQQALERFDIARDDRVGRSFNSRRFESCVCEAFHVANQAHQSLNPGPPRKSGRGPTVFKLG